MQCKNMLYGSVLTDSKIKGVWPSSHSGICNIIEYAKQVCKEEKIYGVIGGFHLLKSNDKLNKTIEYLKENSIKELYPCHCVSLDAKIQMGKELEIKEVGVGLNLEI